MGSWTTWSPRQLLWWLVVPAGIMLRLMLTSPPLDTSPTYTPSSVVEWLRVTIHLSFRPLLVAPQHDPELLAEGVLMYDVGRSPYEGGKGSPMRAPPFLLFLVAGGSSRLHTLVLAGNDGAAPLWWRALSFGDGLWLERLVVVLADVAAAIMLYEIAKQHIATDDIRRRACLVKRWTWQRTQAEKEEKCEGNTSESQSDAGNGALHGWSWLFSDTNLPLFVSTVYLLHPFTVAAAAIGSTEGLGQCALIAAVWAAMRGRHPATSSTATNVSLVVLASASCMGIAVYLDPFYTLFMPSLFALMRNRYRWCTTSALTRESVPTASATSPMAVTRYRRHANTAASVMLLIAYVAVAIAVFAALVVASALLLGLSHAGVGPYTEAYLEKQTVWWSFSYFFDWSWVGPSYSRQLEGSSSGFTLRRPTVGLEWYLDSICFDEVRDYFQLLSTVQLQLIAVPLVAGLACLPSADDPDAYPCSRTPSLSASIDAKNSRKSSHETDSSGESNDNAICSRKHRDEKKEAGKGRSLDFAVRWPSCGALALVAVMWQLCSILHPNPSLRTHATALALLVMDPCLFFGRAIDSNGEAELAPVNELSSGTCVDDENIKLGDSNKRTTAEAASITLTQKPLQTLSMLRGAIFIGTALGTTGMFVMFWLWVCEFDRGNSNFFYFQCLVFHFFQALLACAYITAWIRRSESVHDSEVRAQSQICCMARRWLIRRRRRLPCTTSG